MTRAALFGPYLGEFGWELCCWNPRVRSLARAYEHVTIIAPSGSRPLYEFAHEFVALDPLPGTSDFMTGRASDTDLQRAHDAARADGRPRDVITPASLAGAADLELSRFGRSHVGQAQPEKEWRALRSAEPPSGAWDVALAFRNEKVFNGRVYADKAYPIDQAVRLADLLLSDGFRTVAIGGRDNFAVPCSADLRGASLETQIAALSGCFVCVGPSSAPLHLAQLCEVGVVTWYNRPRAESAGRYEGWWNPFGAPCCFIDGRDPAPGAVLSHVRAAAIVAGRGPVQ